MRPLPALLASASLSLLLVGSIAPAACAAPTLSSPPSHVRAGDLVRLQWGDLPSDVHEVELELRLEGGPWVRISPEMEADEGHYLWRVPDVTSSRAELRLCMGDKRSERALPPSGVFRIEGAPHAGPPRPRSLEGWHGVDLSPGLTREGLRDHATSELWPLRRFESAEDPWPRTPSAPWNRRIEDAGGHAGRRAILRTLENDATPPRFRPMRN